MKRAWLVGLLAGGGLLAALLVARRDHEAPAATAATSPGVPAVAQEISSSPPGTTARLFARPVPGGPKPSAAIPVATNEAPSPQAILESDLPDAEKSAALLTVFPRLPVEEQADLASLLAALTPDAAYAGLHDLLTNTVTPAAVAEILMTDLLNRPVAVRFDTLLEIARSAAHPQSDDAREMLAALLGTDHGTDWDLWVKKISEWRARHPEER